MQPHQSPIHGCKPVAGSKCSRPHLPEPGRCGRAAAASCATLEADATAGGWPSASVGRPWLCSRTSIQARTIESCPGLQSRRLEIEHIEVKITGAFIGSGKT
eukprot:4545290-Pleurochrysis_carterae.AAC.2